MFHVVLYEPEIPPNTGNIIRLCANTGTALHLIHPLGFTLEDSQLKRAGLDYREWARIEEHPSLDAFEATVRPPRTFALSTRGQRIYTTVRFQVDDAFVFGPETRGLPQTLLDTIDDEEILRIPMRPGSRSLNLSNAASVVIYEAWRQLGFARARPSPSR